MAILDVYLLLVALVTGSLVQCEIAKSVAGPWESTRSTCQLLNSSFLCEDGPDTCNLRSDIEVPTGRFWIGAYVHTTTIILYKGCKQVPDGAIPEFTSVNMTLKGCVEKCHTKYAHDNTLETLALHMDSCYCTTRNRQTPDESECNTPCASNTAVTCGGQTSMSTYEFSPVGGTQKSGPLSFSPLCGTSNNKFKNCQDQSEAVCKNNQTSSMRMSWPQANKWCQDRSSQLTIDRTFPGNRDPWINLVKHRFVNWVDGAVPEATTYCVSLMCESGTCSFFSDSCTRQLSGLCWKTQDDNNVNTDSSSTLSPPSRTAPRVMSSGLMPTPTGRENSSYIPVVNVPRTENNNSDGMLVYILVAVAVVVIVILTVILTFIFCRKRKLKQGRPRSKPDSNNIEEPARPLMEQSVREHRGSDDYDRVKGDYDKIREDFVIDTKDTSNSDYDKIKGDYDNIKGDYDNNSGDDDPAYARVTSFAPSDQPEVDDVPKTERDSDNYDLLRTNKRPEGGVDSTYDHIPAETEDDTYNVLQSQENLHKDDIGDFMYDVTSAINGLGNYDTFRNNKTENTNNDYDTAESVLHSDS
ncbi:uncharacterized protein LOC110443203 [Mizuhopecten yessoensis]|uniref:WSC domain-containing protein n=1 Tax=Mizuhopecten yessoensis TaxID=6573 RepID=A0A210PFH6_MIZYE|nr:uncharacterized protein LOC110443203 [Mizuhopecten yessoensis]OWF35217.1 hypothetical protein KP79_PYT05969 [Mizuhopecten yessoensis]